MIAQPQLPMQAVQPLEQPEERRGDDREDAVVDDEVEARRELGEHVLVLRADVQARRGRRRCRPAGSCLRRSGTPAVYRPLSSFVV